MFGSKGFLKGFEALREYKFLSATIQKEYNFLSKKNGLILLQIICACIYEISGWQVEAVYLILLASHIWRGRPGRSALTWVGHRLNNKTDSKKKFCNIFCFRPFQNRFMNFSLTFCPVTSTSNPNVTRP